MGERVLITGASRGLGLALARACAERGDTVFAGARGKADALSALRDRFPSTLRILPLDVSSAASVHAAAEVTARAASALDLVVNNAAIGSRAGTNKLEEVDFEHALETYAVNSLGPLRVTQAFIGLLRRGTGPVLVNISSEAGSIGQARRRGEFAYCMSKAALNMQTKLLANALAPGVRCLSIHPGWVRTDMGGPSAHLDPAESAERVLAIIAQQRGELDGALYFDSDGSVLPW